MSTSGVTTFSLNARDVHNAALEELAVLSVGEAATDAELTSDLRSLNLMLKSWQFDANLWRLEERTETVTGASVVLDPRAIDVTECRLQVGSTERPLERWSWDEYLSLPNKATAGNPSIFTVKRDRAATTLYLWPVPTAKTLNFTVSRVIEDVATAQDDLDVPQEWLECVVTNLALRLAPKYGATPSPFLIQRAADTLSQMRDLDRPSSVFLGACR